MDADSGVAEGRAALRSHDLVAGHAVATARAEGARAEELQRPGAAVLSGEVRREGADRVARPRRRGVAGDLARSVPTILLQATGRRRRGGQVAGDDGRRAVYRRLFRRQGQRNDDQRRVGIQKERVVRGVLGAGDRRSYRQSGDRRRLGADLPAARHQVSREDRVQRRTRQLSHRRRHSARRDPRLLFRHLLSLHFSPHDFVHPAHRDGDPLDPRGVRTVLHHSHPAVIYILRRETLLLQEARKFGRDSGESVNASRVCYTRIRGLRTLAEDENRLRELSCRVTSTKRESYFRRMSEGRAFCEL